MSSLALSGGGLFGGLCGGLHVCGWALALALARTRVEGTPPVILINAGVCCVTGVSVLLLAGFRIPPAIHIAAAAAGTAVGVTPAGLCCTTRSCALLPPQHSAVLSSSRRSSRSCTSSGCGGKEAGGSGCGGKEAGGGGGGGGGHGGSCFWIAQFGTVSPAVETQPLHAMLEELGRIRLRVHLHLHLHWKEVRLLCTRPPRYRFPTWIVPADSQFKRWALSPACVLLRLAFEPFDVV